MKSKNVLLNSITDVKEFVTIVSTFGSDIDLVSGRYIIDAKSIMGIFSLDLTKPITVQIASDEQADKFFADIANFVVE